MNNFFKKIISIAVPILVLIPIILINILPQWPHLDSLLNYAITFATFLGTIYLGYVANKQNQRLIALEEMQYTPLIDITPIKNKGNKSLFDFIDIKASPDNSNSAMCYFSIVNFSNQYICDIKLLEYTIKIGEDEFKDQYKNYFWSINAQIFPNEKKELILTLPIITNSYPTFFNLCFSISIIGGAKYMERIKFDFLGIPEITDNQKFIYNKSIDVKRIPK